MTRPTHRVVSVTAADLRICELAVTGPVSRYALTCDVSLFRQTGPVS